MSKPDLWRVEAMTADEFLLAVLNLGTPLEVAFVGAFDQGSVGRASRRDVDLPPHQDGVRSDALADVQGGLYVERAGVDYVGLYCLRGGCSPCYTTLADLEGNPITEVNLRPGQALIFDNRRLMHGRRGPVDDRVLIRVWIAARSTS